jgi:multicomponent Na+:H+ antiporter subunit A
MVKAGVYLLARLNPSLGGTDVWEVALALAGIATMLLGAVLTLRENDLKRILAYSTLSVLGMLVVLIGMGTAEAMLAAMVMLFAHALYKAALFMLAGIIDYETGTRDIEQLGGLGRAMPITALATGLAAASMAGVAFFIGFVAKESVYEAVQGAPRYAALITAAVLVANILLVAVAILMALKPFFGKLRMSERPVHETDWRFLAGPLVLCALGVALGLLPASVDGELLVPAAAASVGGEIGSTLALWHGVNLTLILSGLTLAGGFTIYLARPTLQQWLVRYGQSIAGYTPEAAYNYSIITLNRIAVLQTRVLQHGYLRGYVATVVAGTAFLTVGTMLGTGAFGVPETTGSIRFYEPVIAIVAFGGALVVVLARTRVVAAIGLGIVGYGVALMYLLFGAPDLALTQVLVETLLVLLFVFAFYRLPRFTNLTTPRVRLRDMTFSIGVGVMVMALMTTALSIQRDSDVSAEISRLAKPVGHGSNIVNVILVDIRALDTLGEISVLLVAAIGVTALLRLSLTGRKDP